MLTAHQLSKSYGLNTVLKGISFSINSGQRIGLIGPNGSGKTTLLKLLIKQEKPDEGHIVYDPPDLRIGYLSQGFEFEPELNLNQVLHQIISDPRLLAAELTRVAEAMANQPQDPELQTTYDVLLAKMSQHDVGQVQAVLSALGLDQVPPDQPVGTLSGGQKTRLALALVLMQNPQLLLLDEPTNHLDILMLGWLEEWLVNFPGGMLIVSHDRTFLDRTVNYILDLDPVTQTIRSYTGNYSDYLETYLKEHEKQVAAFKDQLYEIRRMRQDIQRTLEQARQVERTTTPRQPNVRRLAKKVARKAQSRQKKLDRYLADDERVEKPGRSWQLKLELEDTTYLGQDVLFLEELSVGYTGHPPLLHHLNHQVQAGQRITLTGPNGSGKSSLIRTILGQLPALKGQVRLGVSAHVGYMAQEQELLDPDWTPLDTIRQVAIMNHTEARSFLHYFLFSGDEPLQPNAQLSFGQRARLSLALLVAQGCNFLLLDEPINHLDIPSRERFEQALALFKGTILAVVHDRYFISRFATDLWIVENRQLRTEIL
jgi:ATP-binding cassette subfamily F protein 3